MERKQNVLPTLYSTSIEFVDSPKARIFKENEMQSFILDTLLWPSVFIDIEIKLD